MPEIGKICNREVVFATRETSVLAAARLMRHYHVGTVVVVEEADGKRFPVGIVTDRDIVIEVDAPGLDPKAITVGDIMAAEVVTARESEGILETMEIMRHKGVRRVPIVDRDGQLVGVVSTDDLLEVLAEELNGLTKIVTREQAHEMQVRK